MTLDVVNRLFYVVVWGGGLLAFFGHMRFYTKTGLQVLKQIGTILLCFTLCVPVYGLIEWVIAGDAKVTHFLAEWGIIALFFWLGYYFLCHLLCRQEAIR